MIEVCVPHFFINSECINNNMIIINDKDNYNHIAKSLRAKKGEKLLFIDENKIQYESYIKNISLNTIEADIIDKYPSTKMLNFELYLAQSPLRGDSQYTIIEKATELGVHGIYPIYSDFCTLKKNVIEQKIKKWQRIMYESSKQCERAFIPKCFELKTLEELILQEKFNKILAFTERKAKINLKKYLNVNPITSNERILVIIGPEGGFSDSEFEFFEKNKIITLSLGELILRAETAVIVALGNIVL